MPFPFSPEEVASKDSRSQHSVVIDDLDAFEMLAPTACDSRLFLCKLIQSLSSCFSNKLNGTSSSGSVSGEKDITSGERKRPHKRNILSLAAYGRQMCVESAEKYPLFPGSVRVSCASSTRNDFEPSLTEYCRYR